MRKRLDSGSYPVGTSIFKETLRNRRPGGTSGALNSTVSETEVSVGRSDGGACLFVCLFVCLIDFVCLFVCLFDFVCLEDCEAVLVERVV
jgi:hypothetical protein